MVSSYALDDGEHLLLFDPLAVPSELVGLAAERELVVVLTAAWHERDTQKLVERFGAPVFVPPPDTQEDLMRKFGVTAEQAAGGSPDVAWLLAGGGGEWHPYAAGDRLPIGIEVFPGRESNDLVLWIESVGAVISGDTLVDFGRGLEIAAWLREAVTREQVAEGLRPLLALPVQVVLPTHGAPTDRAALERALA
jgi:glyoxylase-like metal-dependent hydrolase (beta-lactamase superfamily II)